MAEETAPCLLPEARQFDFWLGNWDLTWDSGQGTNHIHTILDGCGIQENFDGTPSISLKGMSLSIYNAQVGKWQQTWIDNDGSYLALIGAFNDGEMTLTMERTVQGKPATMRMRFYNIAPDSLDWSWDRSLDSRETWETLWLIHYRRKADS